MKKSDLRVTDYLDHILEAIARIERYTRGLSFKDFEAAELVQDAVIRNLEIIGEAAHNIELDHADFAASNPTVPWDYMYLMRNRISHGYFAVDLDIVWRTSHQSLPEVKRQIEQIKAEQAATPPSSDPEAHR
jgi:uncharacterized protein with HEPN domain